MCKQSFVKNKAEPGFWDLPLERRENKPLPSQDGMPGQFLDSTVRERTWYVLNIIHILETNAENLICLFHLPSFYSSLCDSTRYTLQVMVIHCLSDSRRLILLGLHSEVLCRCLRDSQEMIFFFILLAFQTEPQCHKAGRDSDRWIPTW